jgi:hypothetical protein
MSSLLACCAGSRDSHRDWIKIRGAGHIEPQPIDRAMAQHISAEVEHFAVSLARMQPEPATHHLVIEAR